MLLETPEKFRLALTKSCSDNSQRCLEMKYRRVPYKHIDRTNVFRVIFCVRTIPTTTKHRAMNKKMLMAFDNLLMLVFLSFDFRLFR